jgi:hypothetical protein
LVIRLFRSRFCYIPAMPYEFGICANVFETDRIFCAGAKVWLAGGTGGEGWARFELIGASRSARPIRKWAPTFRLHNFRAKWIPEHLRDRMYYMVFSDRTEAERIAAELDAFA